MITGTNTVRVPGTGIYDTIACHFELYHARTYVTRRTRWHPVPTPYKLARVTYKEYGPRKQETRNLNKPHGTTFLFATPFPE